MPVFGEILPPLVGMESGKFDQLTSPQSTVSTLRPLHIWYKVSLRTPRSSVLAFYLTKGGHDFHGRRKLKGVLRLYYDVDNLS
jgi:hypothetical protein